MNDMEACTRGLLVVVSGPSGVGKGTVCKCLCEMDAEVVLSISATTRKPRPQEHDGQQYYFLSLEDFLAKIAAGEFLEWAEVYGNYYGTLREQVQTQRTAGYDVILEIDTQGAMQIRSACPDAIFVFLLPPSFGELQQRINGRATESAEIIRLRLSKAEYEMSLADEYDYRIVNQTVEQTASELLAVLQEEKHHHNRERESLC